jgi:hypothetical protein
VIASSTCTTLSTINPLGIREEAGDLAWRRSSRKRSANKATALAAPRIRDAPARPNSSNPPSVACSSHLDPRQLPNDPGGHRLT